MFTIASCVSPKRVRYGKMKHSCALSAWALSTDLVHSFRKGPSMSRRKITRCACLVSEHILAECHAVRRINNRRFFYFKNFMIEQWRLCFFKRLRSNQRGLCERVGFCDCGCVGGGLMASVSRGSNMLLTLWTRTRTS